MLNAKVPVSHEAYGRAFDKMARELLAVRLAALHCSAFSEEAQAAVLALVDYAFAQLKTGLLLAVMEREEK